MGNKISLLTVEMEEYNQIKEVITKKHPIAFEQVSIIASCALQLSTRFIKQLTYKDSKDLENHILNLKTGDRIFIDYHTNHIDHLVSLLLGSLKNNIKLDFVIWAEPFLPDSFIQRLLPYARDIFLTNSTYTHQNIHNMPIGLILQSLNSVYEQEKKLVEKEYLCVLGFQYTHPERKRCYDILGNKDYIVNLNNMTFKETNTRDYYLCFFCEKTKHHLSEVCENQKNLEIYTTNKLNTENVEKIFMNNHRIPQEELSLFRKKSFFTLHPSGAGEACHSFWEALYLDCIPVVKRTNTPYDKLYEVFPCLTVNDWSEVTKEYLEQNKQNCQAKCLEFKQKNSAFFTDLEYTFRFIKENL